MDSRILVTGAAGFIGAFLSKALVNAGLQVVGIDNLNDYYDPRLKMDRLTMVDRVGADKLGCANSEADGRSPFVFLKCDISDFDTLNDAFQKYEPAIVVNLAAQAGVRYSISNPRQYIESNIVGFFNVLECCRYHDVKHLVYASSSSVYGLNTTVPYSTNQKTDAPVSLYAATKKSDELLAYSYSSLYGIPATGLRFFTVYGPMGRPDMAYFKFTDKMVKGEPIQIYNMGDMKRDFTYIDDIVKGVCKVIEAPPMPDEHGVRHAVYNIGNSKPCDLLTFVKTLENALIDAGVISTGSGYELLPMQQGDVYQTYADVAPLVDMFGFRPSTSINEGLKLFAEWYKSYYCNHVS